MWMPSRLAGLTVIAGFLAAASSVPAKLTLEQKCQVTKNQTAGKYAACRQNAEAKLAKAPTATQKYTDALAKCGVKFTKAWQKATDKAQAKGATCLDASLPAGDFQSVIDEHTDNIAAALEGERLETCGGGGIPGQLLRTGQAECWDSFDMSVPCATTGQDGEVKAGLSRAYHDNDDGTISDLRTGLMWEKKSDDDTLHDWDNCYAWWGTCSGDGMTTCGRDADCAGAGGTCDATDCQGMLNPLTVFEWVDELNAASFAGHADWRLPNVNELHSLVDYGATGLLIDVVFNTACAPACTVLTCSCTPAGPFWSSTTYGDDPTLAWEVLSDLGFVVIDAKAAPVFVRAVRGGL